LALFSSISKAFIAVSLDLLILLLFILLKITVYQQQFFSINFVLVWIFISYICGRYSNEDKSFAVSILSEIIKLFSTLLISFLVIFILNFKIIESISTISLNLLIIFFLSSLTTQVIFKINYFNKKNKYLNWLVLASDEEIKQFRKYLREINSPVKLKKLDFKKHDFKFIKKNFRGLIITNNKYIPKEEIQKIKYLASNYLLIISKIKWCENVMQRIPTELIKEAEITNIGFVNNSKIFGLGLKRIGDLSLSIFLLFLTSPIILISSILIWATDQGPIFYSQIRSGYRGKLFRVWKLRSMRVNAEKDSNPIWASKNDPRITHIGSFLRKCRFDELPQLINVINGSMSLIGPRPERPKIEETISKKIKNYNIRSYVKPGLSGWAQVNYPYGASILDSKVKSSYDVFYIKNQSLILDILILFKTIKLVLNVKGSEPIQKDI